AAEYNPLGCSHTRQNLHCLRSRRQRNVVPEAPDSRIYLLARELFHPGIDHRRYRQAPGKIGHQPARVRQHEANTRVADDSAAEYEVDRRARRVEQILHHEARPRQLESAARWMKRRMDEYDRIAVVKRFEHGIEPSIAEKPFAIARK